MARTKVMSVRMPVEALQDVGDLAAAVGVDASTLVRECAIRHARDVAEALLSERSANLKTAQKGMQRRPPGSTGRHRDDPGGPQTLAEVVAARLEVAPARAGRMVARGKVQVAGRVVRDPGCLPVGPVEVDGVRL